MAAAKSSWDVSYLLEAALRRRQAAPITASGWLRVSTGAPRLRNDLQQVVAPENDSVQGFGLARLSGRSMASGDERFGPQPVCPLPRSAAATAADKPGPALAENGFEHWMCQFTAERHG